MTDRSNIIDGIKKQLVDQGVAEDILSNPMLAEFYEKIAQNPEFAKVFMQFYKEYIDHHKEKLISSADGKVDQVFNGHLNVLKQTLSPVDYSDIYIKYQEAEQKFAVDELKHNHQHFQNLIDEERQNIAEILDKNPEYAKMPKFIDLIETQIEAVSILEKYDTYFEAAEEQKSGKRKFAFNWNMNRKKKDLVLVIALLTEELDAEQLEAMQTKIAMEKKLELSVSGVTRAVLENYDEIAKTGRSPKTYQEIVSEWTRNKTQGTEKNTPPVDISYEEILIANIVGGKGVNL